MRLKRREKMTINRKCYLKKYLSLIFHLKNHISLKTTAVIHTYILSRNTNSRRRQISLYKITLESRELNVIFVEGS